MATQERVYTIDDVRRLEQQPLNPTEKYYLIDGELAIKMAPAQQHALGASELSRHLGNFVAEHGLGRVLVECGYHPPDVRRTVLLPDVSFESRARASEAPLPTYAPYMPDLAVEIISPSQSFAQVRRKAEVCLRYGSALVWLLDPAAKFAEVWRRGDAGAPQGERIAADGELSGEDILPGFRLPLSRVFAN